MSRLIDASEFVGKLNEEVGEGLKKREQGEGPSIGFILGMSHAQLEAIVQPTVEAIPVKWIKNFIDRANDTDAYAVAEMLSDWEAEHDKTN